ncbi:MAG: hypothetical protein FJ290_25095 [Planctomycetes bacterium]|nr:hypothetical protein [Planctomycetota bacterium]
MRNRLGAAACSVAMLAAGLGLAGSRKEVQLDAKDVALPDLLALLAAQGGPTLTAHPDVAQEKVTFAAKAMSGWAAARWLCRTANLIIAEGKGGRLVLGRPTLEPSVDRDYSVAKAAPTQEAADAIVNFVKKAFFELHPIRSKGEDGTAQPAFEAVCEKGKLKVSAPPIVQREVATLLRAILKVQPKRGFEDVRVSYEAHEIGFLGFRQSAQPPSIVGEVTVSAADVPGPEAAWALTSAAKVSFYADPWDEGLKKAKVTLQAEKRPLKEVAEGLAKQLGAELCWHDDAWVFARRERRHLFDGLLARAYNTSGGGWRGRFFREGMKGLGDWPRVLPYTVERADDLLLICGPPEAHKPVEDFVKAPVEDDGPPRHRPGFRPGGPKGR